MSGASIGKEEFARCGLHFTDEEMTDIRRGADQLKAAHNDAWRNETDDPRLDRSPDVRKLCLHVMKLHRRARASRSGPDGPAKLGPLPHDMPDLYERKPVEWRQSHGGHWLPEFDENNPDHACKMYGIWAASPGELHVLAGDYTVERWLGRRPIEQRIQCDWGHYAHQWPWRVHEVISSNCDKRAAGYVLIGQGQYLISIGTCQSCYSWLMRGGSLDGA